MPRLNTFPFLSLIAPVVICIRRSSDFDLENQTGGQSSKGALESVENKVVLTDEQESQENSSFSTQGGKVGLIVVDVQECFTESGIGLGNPRGGADYKKNVKAFVEKVRDGGGSIVLLQDYHPKEHISFGNVAMQDPDWKWNPVKAEFWKGKLCKDALEWDNAVWYKTKSIDKSTLNLDFDKFLPMKGNCETDGEEISQPLFPAHCVQETDEVSLISSLCEAAGGQSQGDTCEAGSNGNLKVVRKGMNPGIDSFGGVHDNRVVHGLIKDTNESAHWGLLEFFKDQGVNHVVHIGIADDFCVKTTAFAVMGLGKSKYGIKSASVVPSLSYGIFQQLADREDTGVAPFGAAPKDDTLIKEYESAGVKIETEEQALARLNAKAWWRFR